MSETCDNKCESCGEDCKDRTTEKNSLLEKPHGLSNIKKVIGVVSGKGGVGKSLVTSMLAVLTNRKGYKTAILDADITGPSIPMAFGIHEKAVGNKQGLLPVISKTGIEIMSLNLLLDNDTDPVVWRGPMVANTVKQFWTDVIWNDVDYMFIDLPPGTGDVSLTVFQSIPLDGIVIVTSPQELVSMIVTKAVKMANIMNIPILGIVENMSYVNCPNCSEEIKIFGESNIEELAKANNIPTYSKIPMDPHIAAACDNGKIESFKGNWLDNMSSFLEDKEEN